MGPIGPVGVTGQKGKKGRKGDTGPMGPTGAAGPLNIPDAMLVITPSSTDIARQSPSEWSSIGTVNSEMTIPQYRVAYKSSGAMQDITFNDEAGIIQFDQVPGDKNNQTYSISYHITGDIGTLGKAGSFSVVPMINEIVQPQWATTVSSSELTITATASSHFVYHNTHFGKDHSNILQFQLSTPDGGAVSNVHGSYHIVQLS